MGRSALLLAALVAATGPACLGGGAGAPPVPGTVSGRVVTIRAVGGLVSPRLRPLVAAASVDLIVRGHTSAGARLLRHVHADSRGHFQVRLPAGRYSLQALAGASLPAPVTVRSGRATRVELAESLPVTQKGVT